MAVGTAPVVWAQAISTVHRYAGVDELEIVLTDVDFMTTPPKVFLVAVDAAGGDGAPAYEPTIRDVRPNEVRVRVPAGLPAGRYGVVVLSGWSETDVTALLSGSASGSPDGEIRRIDAAGAPTLAIDSPAGMERVRVFLAPRPRPSVGLEVATSAGKDATIVAPIPSTFRNGSAAGVITAWGWAEKVVRIR